MVDENVIRDDRAFIDEVNWHIRKIQQATGDTHTAVLVEMGNEGYSYMTMMAIQLGDPKPFWAKYGNQYARDDLRLYVTFLARRCEDWLRDAPTFEAFRGRIEKLGLKFVVDLRGAAIYFPQDFIDSRGLYKVKDTEQRYSFTELGIKNFEDFVGYLEWKNEVYCTTEGRKRRLALAEQALRFEEWEQPPEDSSPPASMLHERLLEF